MCNLVVGWQFGMGPTDCSYDIYDSRRGVFVCIHVCVYVSKFVNNPYPDMPVVKLSIIFPGLFVHSQLYLCTVLGADVLRAHLGTIFD